MPPDRRTFECTLIVRSRFTISLYLSRQVAWILLLVPSSMEDGWIAVLSTYFGFVHQGSVVKILLERHKTMDNKVVSHL